MTKKTILKAFNEMKNSINTVKTIQQSSYTKWYKDYESYTNRIDAYMDSFFSLLTNALVLGVITEEVYDYGHALIQNYTAPDYFSEIVE